MPLYAANARGENAGAIPAQNRRKPQSERGVHMPKFTFTGDGRVTIEKPAEHRQQTETERPTGRKPTTYERTRAQVHATGNKWAIENFEATHN